MSMRTALVVVLCVIFGITGLAISQSDVPPPVTNGQVKYSPYPSRTSRIGCTSATRTCTRALDGRRDDRQQAGP